MKKIILFITCLLAATNSLWADDYDFAAINESGQILYYRYIGTTSVAIVPQNNSKPYYNTYPTGKLTIPSSVTYNGKSYSVTSIGEFAFCYCTGLTGTLTIPNSVTNIGDYAFGYCAGFTGTLTIPNSVTSIGWGAFYYCTGLTSVTIPNSVTSIGSSAFYGCTGLTSVTIPNSVTSIGKEAFWNTGWWNNQADGIIYKDGWCLGYKGIWPTGTLTLQEETKGIADRAFDGCSGLTAVTIPNSVTSIGWYVFTDCTHLTTVNFNAENCAIRETAFYNCENLKTLNIGNNVKTFPAKTPIAFSQINSINVTTDNPNYKSIDGVLYNKNATTLIMYPSHKTESFTIPNSVTSIGEYAFYNCTRLTGTLTIPNSVTSIGEYAFYNCTGLTGILTIPNSVTNIGRNAFSGCSGLTSVTIPDSVTSIEDSTFINCSKLTTITIGNGVTSIGKNAFYKTSWWNKQPDGIIYKNGWCLGYKVRPTGTLTILEGAKGIADGAFSGCNGLTSITIPNSVTSIGDGAFEDCSKLNSVTIPNSVTSIRGNAFYDCSGLTSVTIGNGVTSIGSRAFYNCIKITTLNFNAENCTEMGNSIYPAFENCSNIETLTIGENVKTIPVYSFYGCSGLTTITCEAITPPNIESNTFSNYSAMLYVPSEYVQAYRNHAIWSKFSMSYSCIVTAVSSNENMGAVTGGGTYKNGEKATITAIPTNGYKFVNWSDGSTENPRQITLTDDVNLIANFTEIPSYTITLNVNDNTMGSVSGAGTYKEGIVTTITATPKKGYKFISWSDGSTQNPRTFTVTGNMTLIATFEADGTPISYTLTVLSSNNSMGSVSGGGTFEENTTITLTATPNSGYKFVSWNDGNTDNPRNVTVTGNATYIATFAANEGTDAIAEANGNNAQIFGGEKRIIINNAANANVAIYDVMGRTVVKEQRINTNNAVFVMPQTGIYIVRMGKAAKKVWVR